jgi:hypothetical protein
MISRFKNVKTLPDSPSARGSAGRIGRRQALPLCTRRVKRVGAILVIAYDGPSKRTGPLAVSDESEDMWNMQ